MYNREYTPERIMELKPNEIFVSSLNLPNCILNTIFWSLKSAAELPGSK